MDLPPLDVSKPQSFKKWIDNFEVVFINKWMDINLAYPKAEREDMASDSAKMYMYRHFREAIGPAGRDFLSSQVINKLPAADEKSYVAIKKYLIENCQPKQNYMKTIGDLITCTQKEDETLVEFTNRVRLYAQRVTTTDVEFLEKLTLTIIFYGLKDKTQINKILLLDKMPGLDEAIQMLKTQEAICEASRVNIKSEDNIDRVSHRYKKKPGNRDFGNRDKTQSGYSNSKCKNCGRSHAQGNCRATKEKCYNCHKFGHFIVRCPSRNSNGRYRNRRNVNPVDEDEEQYEYADEDENLDQPAGKVFMGEVTTVNSVGTTSPSWTLKAHLGSKSDSAANTTPVDFKIDTGAAVNCIPFSMYERKRWGPLEPPGIRLLGAAETKLVTKGVVTLKLFYKNRVVTDRFYVIDKLKTPLLGLTGIDKLEVVQRIGALTTAKGGEKAKWTQKFPELFNGLGTMKGTYKIELSENSEPLSVSSARRVPLPLLGAVKSELKKLEDQGIIEPIKKPTKYCSPLVVVPKPGGKVRICGDFVHLNKNIRRERFELPLVDDTLSKLSGASVFTKLDANSGFYQIKLDPESSELTTFITPFGRYMYKRLPMGISSAPEFFQREMAQIMEGMPGVACMMDDVGVVGRTKQEHDERLERVLKKLSSEGVTLNLDKCAFGCSWMKYLGHIVDAKGIRADPDKIKAVTELPRPKNVSGVRQFLGMVNQLAKFVPNLADKTKPIRELLHKDNIFVWSEVQDEAFQNLKKILTSTQVLAYYDTNKRTVLSTDASNSGLGACLYQESEGILRPVAYASKSLTDTESRYAIIEKEALAVTWGCERFSQYLLGRHFEIHTDHRPLLASLQTKRLDSLTPRLQRFKMRLGRYDYTITYIPGKEQSVPDALSRAPIDSLQTFMETDIEEYNVFSVQSMPISSNQLENVIREQQKDPVLSKLIEFFKKNKGKEITKNDFPLEIREFMPIFYEITIVENILLRGKKIIIPTSMRKEMLHRIHQGHQGINKCQRLARDALWWPRINQEIENMVNNCESCSKHQVSRAEPMLSSKTPSYPWQKIGADFFEWNNTTYLLLVDYLSRWIEIAKMTTTSGTRTVDQFKSIFAKFGIPEEIRTDNGPQFISHEFKKFCAQYEINHTTSSPRYPQSNGESERAVRTIKNLLKKCEDSNEDPYIALLNYRTAPLEAGMSPAEIMLGRKPRTLIPRQFSQLTKRIPSIKNFIKADMEKKEKIKGNYDRRRRVKEKQEFRPQTQVYLPEEKTRGEIISKRMEPRSYDIRTPSGILRRNTSQFNPIPFRRRASTTASPPATASATASTTASTSATTSTTTSPSKMPRLRNEIKSFLKPGVSEQIRPPPTLAPRHPLDRPRRNSERATKGLPPERFSAGDPPQ